MYVVAKLSSKSRPTRVGAPAGVLADSRRIMFSRTVASRTQADELARRWRREGYVVKVWERL